MNQPRANVPDVFAKCSALAPIDQLRKIPHYPFFHPLESAQGPEVTIGGRRLVMLAANDYLGLSTDPRVKDAAVRAVECFGAGCGASRLLAGTMALHEELEAAFASFLGKEQALVFTTGMQTNLGIIQALVGKEDTVITDKLDHASILDGCRLSNGEMTRFRHNDCEDLERVLSAQAARARGVLVAVEGVYSMDGDMADVPRVIALARRHGARVLLDDAHGLGVLGQTGAGTAEHFGCLGEVDLVMGTFSKAFAAIGGVVAGPTHVINHIRHSARSMIFSAALPPPVVAAVRAALDIVRTEPERRGKLMRNAAAMRAGLADAGFDTGSSSTPIIPVRLGSRDAVFSAWRALFEAGVFAAAVLPPAVPPGREMLRVSVTAAHTAGHIETALNAFRALC
ncbi:pyridoxal phosphate-dependent aminotransferase family protein [bacterium]|nr:pyridoxal phosphate-dependent aminotransferase family protein [bacterium]